MTNPTLYDELLALLDQAQARYRVLAHAPEGRTEIVSALRGHEIAAAAKCIVLLAKRGRKVTKNILAVVPGDARVDLDAVKALLGATYVGFASRPLAEELGRTTSGAILPFVFDQRLELLVDPRLLERPEVFFNAARLDRSIVLATDDYVRIANPHVARISRNS